MPLSLHLPLRPHSFTFFLSITHLKCPQQWQIIFFLFNLANYTEFYNIHLFQSLLKHRKEKTVWPSVFSYLCFLDEHRLNSARLCLIILTCIAEVGWRLISATFAPTDVLFWLPLCVWQDQYADAFLHDDNMNFRVNLHRMVSFMKLVYVRMTSQSWKNV